MGIHGIHVDRFPGVWEYMAWEYCTHVVHECRKGWLPGTHVVHTCSPSKSKKAENYQIPAGEDGSGGIEQSELKAEKGDENVRWSVLTS